MSLPETIFSKRFLAAVGAVLLFLGGLVSRYAPPVDQNADLGHGGAFESVNYVAAIGTSASPATLTTAYSGASSTPMTAMGLPNMTIAGTYTPRSYGSKALLLLERSIDNGATYQPYTVLEPRSTDVLVYTSGSSTTSGIPFIIPGTGGSTSGTAIGFSFDLSVVADFIRLSAKEMTTSTAGTISVRSVLTSN